MKMEILTAHQPTYMPWLGLFHKIAVSDAFIFLDGVQYSKKQFYNRNKIKTSNGPLWLTVPILTSGKAFDILINEAAIDSSIDWRKQHWRSIELNYRRSQYFSSYKDFFEGLYKRPWNKLADLNKDILKYMIKEFKISVEWIDGKDIKPEGIKTDLVINMCEKAGTKCYVFGKLGEEYAQKQKFHEKGIEIYFQDYKHPVYPQLFGAFMPYMSAIDLLFNCGEKSLSIIMRENITKDGLKEWFKQSYRK